jgi:hypothetical protein
MTIRRVVIGNMVQMEVHKKTSWVNVGQHKTSWATNPYFPTLVNSEEGPLLRKIKYVLNKDDVALCKTS